ncbi:MAG: DegT/DnrJ/EryC1/StrS family aminotransferase, partial [Coriobacteriaceae bacterium]|nr:DegT/DnrJ/EryC1/StrS family aminotransferase [Coriobacteriaceae bacterium]
MTDNANAQRTIAFSPPDITEAEIAEVANALRSGWITTGPRTKELEGRLREFTGADGFACF